MNWLVFVAVVLNLAAIISMLRARWQWKQMQFDVFAAGWLLGKADAMRRLGRGDEPGAATAEVEREFIEVAWQQIRS